MTAEDRVRRSTADEVNRRIDAQAARDAQRFVGNPQALTRRLSELDQEWDTERVLETNASILALTGVLLGATVSRRWLWLAGVVPAFLLQHALQGWCPPIEVIRRLGVRTRREIDTEREALRALRGDFDGLSSLPVGTPAEREAAVLAALQTARR